MVSPTDKLISAPSKAQPHESRPSHTWLKAKINTDNDFGLQPITHLYIYVLWFGDAYTIAWYEPRHWRDWLGIALHRKGSYSTAERKFPSLNLVTVVAPLSTVSTLRTSFPASVSVSIANGESHF